MAVLLAATSATAVSGSEGWQTIDLTTPVEVDEGQKIWLAWIFQNIVTTHYATQSPYRARSNDKEN